MIHSLLLIMFNIKDSTNNDKKIISLSHTHRGIHFSS